MKKIYLTLATALFFISAYSQSETCAGATELTNDGQFSSTNGNTAGKSNEGGNSSPDVFYFITPGATQTVNVSLCLANNFDSQLRIYSDCTLSTIIAENNDGITGCGLQSQVSFQSDATSTYVVMVEGADNPLDVVTGDPSMIDSGAFEISVWFEAPVILPPAAVGVSCTNGVSGPSILFSESFDDANLSGWTGDIVTSSAQSNGNWEFGFNSGAGSHTGNTGPSVPSDGSSYLSFEASGNTTATASAVSPLIDLTNLTEEAELTFYMHAFGNGIGDLVVRVGNSNTAPLTTELWTWSGQYQSAATDAWFQVGLDLTPYLGQQIYLEFEQTGIGNLRGDMAIDLVEVTACSIPNDACVDAVEILAIPYNITQDASSATNNSGSINPAGCGTGMNDGAWYTFTPLADGTGDISITNVLGWDAELAIYSGSCGAFVCEASTDLNGVGGDESLSLVDVTGGVQYWINIGNASDVADMSEGSFDLTVDGSAGVLVLTVAEEEILDKVSLYPNPANEIINIQSQEIIDEIKIYNLLGQQLRFVSPELNQTSIDIADFEVGVYIVKVKIGDVISSYRILKK